MPQKRSSLVTGCPHRVQNREVIFLIPWAVSYRELGAFGFVEGFLFVMVLGVGLLYAWKKRALDWD